LPYLYRLVDGNASYGVGEIVDVRCEDIINVDDIGQFEQGQYYWSATVMGFGDDDQVQVRYHASSSKEFDPSYVDRSLIRKRRYPTPEYPFREGGSCICDLPFQCA
jgi:hypothetical protein